MLNKPKTCFGCPLYEIGQGFSIPEGSGRNGVLIIGEALGFNEMYYGTPFVKSAEAGSCLEDVFRRLKVQRDDFALWNLIACRPPNNLLEEMEYEEEAIEHCKVYMDRVIEKYKPKVIVAAGNLPLKYLTKFNGVNKDKQSITMIRGYLCDGTRYKIPVIPTLHPSFVNRMGRKHVGILQRDIGFALEIAKGKKFIYEYNYNINPTYQELYNFYLNCKIDSNKIIAYDIETPYTKEGTEEFEYEKGSSEITQIQFSIKKGEAIVIDAKNVDILKFNEEDSLFHLNKNEWYNLIKLICELSNQKISWNGWDFDSYILKLNGINVVNDTDLMWCYHHINPDLGGRKMKDNGMALGAAANLFAPELPAWKHLMGVDIGFYGGLDVDSLTRIYPELKAALESIPKFDKNSKNLWEGVNDDVIKLWPILVKMTKRGLPIDRKIREEFIEQVKNKIEETKLFLRKTYPEELRNRKPVEGFVNPPKELKETLDEFNRLCNYTSNDNNFLLFRNGLSKSEYRARFIEQETRRVYKVGDKEKEYSGLVIREFELNGVKTKRYCRLEEFNPRSKDQTIAFINWVGDETPKRGKKGVYKETTGKDKIHELWVKTGDPFYKGIIFIRELEKLLDTYLGDGITSGWIIGEDNRVHSSFKPYPATGQLAASEAGNVLAVPKYGGMHSTEEYRKIATDFRNCIVAKPNHTFLTRDYSSFHALTIGVEAEDENYIRMVRNDIHSFVASHILANTIPDRFDKLNKKAHLNFNELEEMYLLEQTVYLLKDLNEWPNLPDNILREKLKWIKEKHEFTRNRIAKSAILGIGFGMTVFKFLDLYKEHVKTKQFAQLIFDILYNLFPNLFIFQKNICELADKQSYLVSRYGYIRWFYHVFDRKRLDRYKEPKFGESITKDKYGNYWLKTPRGSDAKEVIAFLPANHAFGKIKEAMREMEDLGLNEKYRLLLQTHDELMFEVPNEYLDEAIQVTKDIMEKPSKVIINKVVPQGLVCNTEAAIGIKWGDMKKVKE